MHLLRSLATRQQPFTLVFTPAIAGLASLTLWLSLSSMLPAANVHYNAASGDWTDLNWTGGVGSNPPVDGDAAFIGSNTGVGTAAVNVTTDLSAATFPSVTLGSAAGNDGTLDLEVGGVLTATTLTVGSNGTGTLNHNGGTLNATNITIGDIGPGTLNLNGNTLSATNFFTLGAGTVTLNRGGGSLSVGTQLDVQGAGNTFIADTSDTITGVLRANENATIDLNGEVGYSVPTTLQIGGGTPGTLARTGGGTFDVTNFWVRGGSSVTTVAGDQTTNLDIQQTGATLTLGTDFTMTGNATILSGGTINLDGNELAANNITLGTGSFTINRGAGGTLNASTQLEVQGAGNTYVADSSVTIGGTLRADSDGAVDLNGIAGFSVPTLLIGGGTPGNLVRTGGGTFDVTNFWVRGGSTVSTVAGDAVSNQIEVQQAATLSLGASISPAIVTVIDSSTLNVPAGTTVTTSSLTLGELAANPVSTFNLGTSAGTATVSPSSGNINVFVDKSGELRGWGAITSGDELFNVGRVIADGFGSEAAPLDLSDFNSVNTGTTGRENAVGENHGWFAINRGRLILPDVGVGSGSGVIVKVGESTDPDDIDLINSMQLEFGTVTAAGTLSVDILATDRSDVEPILINPIAVYDVNAEGGLAFGSFDLTVRYDDIQAALDGLVEGDLRLLHFNGSGWDDITTGIDTVDKLITATGLTSLSQFAIATGSIFVPEPSTSLLLSLGLVGLVRRARRRKR